MVDQVIKNGANFFDKGTQYSLTIPYGTAASTTGLVRANENFLGNIKLYHERQLFKESNDLFVFQVPDTNPGRYSIKILGHSADLTLIGSNENKYAGYYVMLYTDTKDGPKLATTVKLTQDQKQDQWFDDERFEGKDFTNTFKIQTINGDLHDINSERITTGVTWRRAAFTNQRGDVAKMANDAVSAERLIKAGTGHYIEGAMIPPLVDALENFRKSAPAQAGTTPDMALIEFLSKGTERNNAQKAVVNDALLEFQQLLKSSDGVLPNEAVLQVLREAKQKVEAEKEKAGAGVGPR